MDLEWKASCDGFPTDSTSSSKSGVAFPCVHSPKKTEKPCDPQPEPICTPTMSSTSTTSSTISTAFFNSECRLQPVNRAEPPNIGYEVAIAKSIMQQYSTLSGDNLFDHISDIIKRVIDERPPNVIDFFEEFSRNVREQKLHLPERFPPDTIYEETRAYRMAKKMLLSMKLPEPTEPQDFGAAEDLSEEKEALAEDLKLELHAEHKFITFNERVQHLQFFWNQCGFGISVDDIFQLACSMNRLQTHSSILQCRFWGMINGLKASYYIVEASLTRDEIASRLQQMVDEIKEKQKEELSSALHGGAIPAPIGTAGPEMIPGGCGWENWPADDLAIMQPPADPIPKAEVVDVFDAPPEVVGMGANRFSYFVVNSVSDDWIELPIVTPKQIQASRQMQKFLTGDLETEIVSYPYFPGKEKHYLRTLIGRITAGTYIAPFGYYRKMTKREKRIYAGFEVDDEEEEEEEELPGEDEEEVIDNDIMLLKNERYIPQPIINLTDPAGWVHVRSNLLKQGRVVWFDEEKARRDREKEMERMRKLELAGEMEDVEEGEEEDFDEEDVEDEEVGYYNPPEIGPPMLNPCSLDVSEENTVPWVARFTSKFTNRNERVLIMQSNVWPGAYTFTYDKLCDSIYMGWGHKYVARNMAFAHLPQVLDEYAHTEEDFIEATDPTVADEELYRQQLLAREKHPVDEAALSDFDDEYESGSEDVD